MKEKRIIAYKGFDKNLCCQRFQYEVGKEYEHSGEVKCDVSGFHACINPLDVFAFYHATGNNRFCKVEQYGDTDDTCHESFYSDCASSKIAIKEEIGIWGIFKDALAILTEKERLMSLSRYAKSGAKTVVQEMDQKVSLDEDGALVFSDVDGSTISSIGWRTRIGSTGMFACITSTGGSYIGSTGRFARIYSHGLRGSVVSSGPVTSILSSGKADAICSMGEKTSITSTGDRAAIFSSGNCSKIYSTGCKTKVESIGLDSVVTCLGRESIIKARKGSWITLAEWDEENYMTPLRLRTKYVDNDRIKADTWYTLIDGKFCVVE